MKEKSEKIQKGYNLINKNSTFAFPIFTFPLEGNIIIYTPIQESNREKYFNLISYRRKNAESGGK